MLFLFWNAAEFALGSLKVSQLLGNLNVLSFLQGGNYLGTHSPQERFKKFRILVTADLIIYVHTSMTLISGLHGSFQPCQQRWKYFAIIWRVSVGAKSLYSTKSRLKLAQGELTFQPGMKVSPGGFPMQWQTDIDKHLTVKEEWSFTSGKRLKTPLLTGPNPKP